MQHVMLHIIPLNTHKKLSLFFFFYIRPDPSSQFRLAIGSYVEQYSNSVQIVKKQSASTSTDDLESQLFQACEFDHPYPCTKISWSPDAHNQGGKDLLATTGDYLRIWNLVDDSLGKGMLLPNKEALLNNVSDKSEQRPTRVNTHTL